MQVEGGSGTSPRWEEFATISHITNLLLQRQAFITQAFLHEGGAAGGCGLSP